MGANPANMRPASYWPEQAPESSVWHRELMQSGPFAAYLGTPLS